MTPPPPCVRCLNEKGRVTDAEFIGVHDEESSANARPLCRACVLELCERHAEALIPGLRFVNITPGTCASGSGGPTYG